LAQDTSAPEVTWLNGKSELNKTWLNQAAKV